MSLFQSIPQAPCCPVSPDDLRRQMHERLDQAIDACSNNHLQSSFFDFEKAIREHVAALGLLLISLFLLVRHQRLDLTPWRQLGFRIGESHAERNLHTTFGELRYRRDYLIPSPGSKGSGVHPLDAELGLTRDGYSPLVISWFSRLCTRLSFGLSSNLGGMFLGWAPAASTIEEWALGLGRPAYGWLSSGPLPQGDGEILVIECDCKAIPTATEEELDKRRGPRKCKTEGCNCKRRKCKTEGCNCKRHRGRASRKAHGPKKKRKRGDKSKNGRSATLVAMYTLKCGEDGKLHGPINKKIFATFSSREKALQWAREQATRRGFPPDTHKTIQLVVDGEICLEQQLRGLFPQAILTLDIRHAQERLWRVGRLLHKEDSEELAAWVEPLGELLYNGEIQELLKQLEAVQFHGPGSKAKREGQSKAIEYLRKRVGLMEYGKWREQDLVLASGVVEGAARYVVGERLDCSGMRWVVERAEAVLLLRCIEVNGDWDGFFAWSQQQWQEELRQGKAVQIRSEKPTQLPQLNQQSEKRRRSRKVAAATAETAMAA